jgi:hypothetical protein
VQAAATGAGGDGLLKLLPQLLHQRGPGGIAAVARVDIDDDDG